MHSAPNPYLIQGPALISFSGGRTSGYMLKMILDAHGGVLPPDVHVAFANTGKEREETLRFVHECGSRWGARIRWLEWRPTEAEAASAKARGDGAALWMSENAEGLKFAEVGFNSASRNGQPFDALIATRQMLPNVTMRFCTTQMKVNTMRRFMVALGYERWANPVGLRYDEGWRVMKQIARNDAGKERYTALMPLSKARVTKRDVLTFWLGPTMRLETGDRPQGFDLELQSHEGNCDLCFLKRRSALKALIDARPSSADWWIAAEIAHVGKTRNPDMARFNKAFAYAGLREELASSPSLFDFFDDDHDVECGLLCAPEDEAA